MTADRWNFAEGEQITDELTAVSMLGGGETYDAYLAFDEVTYGPVIVKVVRPHLVEDGSGLRSLRREAAALAAVNHPVVIRSLRHEVAGPRPHLVLEQADGPRLSTLIRRYGPLQEAQYLPLAIDLASALHYLRRIDYTHLDIKPSNIIMGAPARLIDLSVARPSQQAAELTHAVGTDAYMAPEQVDPPHTGRPGPASDVWSLGATLFEAIAGEPAYAEGDPDHPDAAGRAPQLVDAPRALPDRVPSEVAKIVDLMLAPEPDRRPAPHQVAEALEPVLARLPKGRLAGFKVRA